MLTNSKLTLIALLLAAGALGFAIWSHARAPKIGYVRLKEVFDKFDMKKELELNFQKENGSKQQQLDSFAFALKQQGNALEAMAKPDTAQISDFKLRQDGFMMSRDQFEKDSQEKTALINTQIVTRMQQYVRDYGNENGYSAIIGDDGNGSLMYGSDVLDVTAPVVTYLNQRYAGK